MSATTADDVAETVEEWLAEVHGIEAETECAYRRHAGEVQLTIRTDALLPRAATDGMRDKGFNVAVVDGSVIGDGARTRSVWVRPIGGYE